MDHNILFTILWEAGIRGITLKWFSSYLNGRNQCISVKDSTNYVLYITFGVLQDLVTVPILFIIYINTLSWGILKARLLVLQMIFYCITQSKILQHV